MLILLCLSVYVPGLAAIPPVDRDESRFAQASRQMFESGDYVIPRIQDRPRLNKPPLIYWLQCGSIAIFGDAPGQYSNSNIWVFRVPSVLMAIGAVLLTWRIGLRLFDPRAAILGGALLAVCPMVAWDAHQARADQLLLCCTTGAMWGLCRIWKPARGERSVYGALALWTFVALGILSKGPITPMVVGLTVAALVWLGGDRGWLKRLGVPWGLMLVGVLVTPWVAMVADRTGWSEYFRIVVDETIGRSASPKENHWFPPGFHLLLLGVLFWPGSLMTGLAVGWAIRRGWALGVVPAGGGRVRAIWNHVRSDTGYRPARFLLAWIVPSWIVFELIATKLPHYTMPLYPAIALLSARAVLAAAAGRWREPARLAARIGFGIWVAIGSLATVGLSLLVIAQGHLDGNGFADAWRLGIWLPGIIIVATLIAAARSLRLRAYLRAQILGMVAIVAWGATFLQIILPRAERFWITPRVVAAMPSGEALAAIGYVEDSLLFMTRGRTTRLSDPQYSAGAFAGATWLLHPVDRPPPGLPADDADAVTIRGYNYSNGRQVHLLLRPIGDRP